MRDSDAFAWYMEQDPTLRSTIVAVAWLERSPDWDRLVAKIDRATRHIPIFRQRVVEPPARLATPRWIVDDQFDLAWHVRRIDSPAPHTPETVVVFARNAAMTAFDHARPLWEFTLVEHLEGGRAALVMKVHHALTDGIGGMDLALELFDRDANADDDIAAEAPAAVVDAPAHSTWSLVRDSVVHDCERVVGFVGGTAGSALPLAWHTARHPVAAFDEVLETVRSLARTVAPVSETRSPIMKRRSTARHFDMLEVRVDDLKRAAAAADGSLNDAFMAAVSGGLCRYHDRQGASVADLRVTLPISIRTPEDPPGGNRITLMRFAVPIADPDPGSRIRAMTRLCRAARDERSLHFTGAIAGMLNLLPRGVIGGMLKQIDFLASDIPGFTFPVHLAGARVDGYVAFAPTVGTSVNFALLSYNGTCCVGISIDSAAVDAPDLLVECVRDGFEEVLALGGVHEPVRRPLTEPGARTCGSRPERERPKVLDAV